MAEESKMKKIGLIIFVIILITLLVISPYLQNEGDIEGTFSETFTFPQEENPYGSVRLIEYNEIIYGFFSYQSKNTYDGDDVIGPDEYSLNDLVIKTWDGINWSAEIKISDPLDETSEQILYVCEFSNEIYTVWVKDTRVVENITGNEWDGIIWNKTCYLKSFNGEDWTNHGEIIPFENIEERTEMPSMLIYNNEIWSFWKNNVYYEENDFSYRRYTNGNWSEIINFTLPSINPNNLRIVNHNGELFGVWDSQLLSSNSYSEIYLGKFNGTGFDLITKVNNDDERYFRLFPTLISYNNELFIFWDGNGIEYKRYSNDTLSNLNVISGCGRVVPIIFNDQLFVAFTDESSHHIFLTGYDGNKWNRSKSLNPYNSENVSDVGIALYQEKLIIFWKEGYTQNGILYKFFMQSE